MQAEKPLPQHIDHDLIVTKNKLGHFHLCVPAKVVPRPVFESPTVGVIACDPGVRTFLTGYDPSGRVIEYGKTDISRIHRLCHAYDKLQSKWTKTTHKHRSHMKKAGLRIQLKIRNLVDEMHKKLSLTLLMNYTTILLPKFESSQMVGRSNRRITSRTAKAMLTWSHYRFRHRLLTKSREYPWSQVVLCTEEFTSKTCTCCGHLHEKLGGNKLFACPSCEVRLDRDVNGARNILLKYLTESSPSCDDLVVQR
jgi:putative transposase